MKEIMKHILAMSIISLLVAACGPRVRTGEDIQRMIDSVAESGGGKVTVPRGTYNVGSLQLKSGVELHLNKGAVILGSTRSEDYDTFPEEVCSIRPEDSGKVLIYAYDASNIAITGPGVVDGQGPAFFDTTATEDFGSGDGVVFYPKPPVERPRMVQFVRCNGIRLQGVTFKDSPCWTMFIRFCQDIDIQGITVTADQRMINNDGIDFDGCSHVRVSDSDFKTCDDCLILRAMRENSQQHVVCEDIEVTDCRLDSRCQAVRLGCPSDDTIRDAVFRNITATGRNGIFADYPTRYLHSDDEGYMDISNILFDGFTGSFTGSALQVASQPGVRIRRADSLTFRNFDVRSALPIRFVGNAGCEIGSVTLENFRAEVEQPGEPCIAQGCNGLVFRGVTLNGAARPEGPVAAEPGSDARLQRGVSASWEAARR